MHYVDFLQTINKYKCILVNIKYCIFYNVNLNQRNDIVIDGNNLL